MTASKRAETESVLLRGLTPPQRRAVSSNARRLLVIAGAGSGKTEVMARRVAWLVSVKDAPKDGIVAFTFTERAAEEMKFRIREQIGKVTAPGEDATLGDMYVGTIHGFCLAWLRQLAPNQFHNYDVLDDAARLALVQRGFHGVLGLAGLQTALKAASANGYAGQYATIDYFLQAYDLLNEYDELKVALATPTVPARITDEWEWCKAAKPRMRIGTSDVAKAFANSAARFYAYQRCRRFLDFSTSQAELVRLLQTEPAALDALRERLRFVVVDEVQDVNPIQDKLVRLLLGEDGSLTAVGDHRQAIFGWRGGRVEIMGTLHDELDFDDDGEVVELPGNFRSTTRVIDIANDWAASIGPVKGMGSPSMSKENPHRDDHHDSHAAILSFPTRADEAAWIASTITKIVDKGRGVAHDAGERERGITYADIAILIRSATDARTYMQALERVGIHPVFRAGPDLFSQPEVQLLVACMCRISGIDTFYGSQFSPKSFPNRLAAVLGCPPEPEPAIRAACALLRATGLSVAPDAEDRLLLASELLGKRLRGEPPATEQTLRRLRTAELVRQLSRKRAPRRVFPQTVFQLLLAEAGVEEWDRTPAPSRGAAAMFHLGALSTLVRGIETPGWTDADDFRYQMIALYLWGSQNARTEEAPLLVEPSTVTISTVHSAKGLEWPVVFVADVCASRFPSNFAKRAPDLPFEGALARRIDASAIADNDNNDQERRLMYVALTRAERFLFISRSGKSRSRFFKELEPIMSSRGGRTVSNGWDNVPAKLRKLPSEHRRDVSLTTSFSDLRYFLECPHDFYLRKVLGFAPSIDQAFGYGRGVHNLMRAIHADSARWAALAPDRKRLNAELQRLIDQGLFYLRYTTGAPLERLHAKGLKVVSEYVTNYAGELARLTFEPEREFETLLEEEQVMISGAIDVIRLDDPPRVTLLDFKSGDADSETASKLAQEDMRLQVSLYALAAKRELEYEPERGLVRYLGETDPTKRELVVDFSDQALRQARELVANTAGEIRSRRFHEGPRREPRDKTLASRCAECDFILFCGLSSSQTSRPGAGT